MAQSLLRMNVPSWPPTKDSYARLDDSDDLIPLRSKSDQNSSEVYSVPSTPYNFDFRGKRSTVKNKVPFRGWQIDGWKGGARVAFYSATTILLGNIILMIVGTTALQWMDGLTMVYIGSCERTETINTWVHLVVNILSTGLLAASNYCMQLLSAPTRADIDKAHSRGQWLDIGIPSVRNLKSLRKTKVVLWWILALSSIPLHLFYNSVFFSAMATNDYNILYATADFVTGAAYNKTMFPDTINLNVTDLQLRSRRFQRLENPECIKTYAQDFITQNKGVIAIVRDNNTSSSLMKVVTAEIPNTGFSPAYNAFAWICDDPKTVNKTNGCCENKFGFIPCADMAPKLETIANVWWRSGGYDIEYCLSEPVEPRCHEHFAPAIMAPVLFFSILKTFVIWYVAFRYKDTPLITLGDAIENFIITPDPMTKGMCLANQSIISKQWSSGCNPQPIRFIGKPGRWSSLISHRQKALLGGVLTLGGLLTITGITAGTSNLSPSTFANAWSIGLGKVRQQNLITGLRAPWLGGNAIIVSTLIANTPQSLFSFIYLVYNAVFSTMFLGREWDRFGTHSKGRILRVSSPKATQRSTYFLSMPYRYALVLLSCSGILHWLVSQSIYLANILILPLDGHIPMKDEITTCAYSPKAMVFLLVLVIIMMIWITAMGCRKYSGRMILVGSNSAAISAACHVQGRTHSEREEMVLRALRWGATDFGNKNRERKATISSNMTSANNTPFLTNTPWTPTYSETNSARTMKATGYQQAELQPLQNHHSPDLLLSSTSYSPSSNFLSPSLKPPPPPSSSSSQFPFPSPQYAQRSRFTELDITDDERSDEEDTHSTSTYYHDRVSGNGNGNSNVGFGGSNGRDNKIGHCSFSDAVVVAGPVVGRLYS